MHALNAHLERMLNLLVPSRVKIVTLVPTNRNPILRNAFQCKKDTTGPVQQPKSNVQRVKQETVVVQLVKNATEEDFKPWRETQHVSIVPVGGVIQPMGRRHVMLCLRVLTVGMAPLKNVIKVIFVKVTPSIKPLAYQDFTPPELDPVPALNAHPERMPIFLVLVFARAAAVERTSPIPMLSIVF